jgi:hypothetical protein
MAFHSPVGRSSPIFVDAKIHCPGHYEPNAQSDREHHNRQKELWLSQMEQTKQAKDQSRDNAEDAADPGPLHRSVSNQCQGLLFDLGLFLAGRRADHASRITRLAAGAAEALSATETRGDGFGVCVIEAFHSLISLQRFAHQRPPGRCIRWLAGSDRVIFQCEQTANVRTRKLDLIVDLVSYDATW